MTIVVLETVTAQVELRAGARIKDKNLIGALQRAGVRHSTIDDRDERAQFTTLEKK